ncbi:hypothetical protein JCM24511_06409 [Saitozyma sp. JCM 24511]|nr:hypothetical protein JCM24511_06409 [Saitozyma sp. JCM 24511]
MTSTPSLATLSQRLTSTSSLLLERSRVLSLNLPPSASSQNQIVRNLTLIRGDLDALEQQMVSSGLSTPTGVGAGVGGRRKSGKRAEGEAERQVREMGETYDRLIDTFSEDPVGKEKSKGLKRVTRTPSPPSPVSDPFGGPEPDDPFQEPTLPVVNVTDVESPTAAGEQRDLPFRDHPEREGDGDRTPQEMLSQQQVLMDDQDERLNLLSNSIGRQNHLSIQIGSELDLHHELLEETDAAMDRTASRLHSARRRLDRVADDAKQYGSTITIVVLILILLILIIVFKT